MGINLAGTNNPPNTTYTRDSHGGKAEEHKAEMRKIAEETIYELVPKISAEIYNNAL